MVGRRLLDIWRILISVQIPSRGTGSAPELTGLGWNRASIRYKSSSLRVESLALVATR